MGVFSSRPHTLVVYLSEGAVDVPGNQSIVNWSLWAYKHPSWTSYSSLANPWSTSFGSGTWTYNFGTQSSVLLGSGSFWYAHNPDGTASIAISASATGSSIGSASDYTSITLTTIPRASTPTFEQPAATPVTLVDAGTSVKILTNRASSSFTHDITYAIGAASGTIGTGITTDTTWTPPLSLMNEFPNSEVGAVTITTKTYNGATLIGTKDVTLNVAAPTTVVPDFTTVTKAEATVSPDVATLVGAFVQGVSTLALAITGAAGAYGSTITGYKIEVAGQTINTATGTTTPLAVSGTYNITGTVTDSRGRQKQKTVSITVLPYLPPAITTINGERADSAGVPATEGTYIRVNISAAVQSLLVSAVQKNALTYKIYSRLRGDTIWTLKKTVTPGGLTFGSFDKVNTYDITHAYEVRVDIIDIFATSTTQFTVAVAAIFMHWDGSAGVGFGKFREFGRIDSAGDIYQGGYPVVDFNDLAGTSTPGIAPFATNAEALTGTLTTKMVKPASLAYIRDQGMFDSRYFREDELDSVWMPVIPTTIASSGSTATFNSTTGLVTCPAGCTMIRMNGIFAAGYEYLIQSKELDSFSAYTDQMLFRFTVGGTPNTVTTYYMVGRYMQYDGSNGAWIYNAVGYNTWGIGYTAGGMSRREMIILGAADVDPTFIKDMWNYVPGAAREIVGNGSHNAATAFDGIQVYPSTGSFAGSMRVLRRKVI